jgi:hypothetical protein
MLPNLDPTGLASSIKGIVDAFQYDKCQPVLAFPTFNSGADKYRHGEIKPTSSTFIPSPKPNSIDEFLNSVSSSWENLVKLVESMNAYDRNRNR